MNNVERNMVASSIAATIGWLAAWQSDETDIPRRAKITEAVTATLAFIESDGLSHTMWHWYPAWMRGRPINEQAIKLVETRWQDKCEMNAMLAHANIDFDIFDVSNEDVHNSLIRRKQAAGNPCYGYEYVHPTDASDDWLDDQDRHGYSGEHDIGCREGFCDMECLY